jgi:gamma-glutamyl-gamma-aminobutyraldehyde dehydrogenase
LLKFTDLIGKNSRELAVMESLESGKPIRECELVDLPETIHCIEWHAEAADKIYDQLSPSGHNAVGLIVREPIGVVACVLPWNFPLMMVAWKLVPALAMGNIVVIKPEEQTSMTTLRLAELALEAGIPAGVINVVPGYGHEAGQALGLHNDVQMVSFTGSTEIGRKFLEFSAQSNLKKIVLECGGKNPSVRVTPGRMVSTHSSGSGPNTGNVLGIRSDSGCKSPAGDPRGTSPQWQPWVIRGPTMVQPGRCVRSARR